MGPPALIQFPLSLSLCCMEVNLTILQGISIPSLLSHSIISYSLSSHITWFFLFILFIFKRRGNIKIKKECEWESNLSRYEKVFHSNFIEIRHTGYFQSLNKLSNLLIRLLQGPLFPHLFPMKWWDQIPWSSFSECWALSQLFTLLVHFHQEAF